MTSVRVISENLARRLVDSTGRQDQEAKMAYGLEMIIGESSKILVIILLSLILNITDSLLLVLAAVIPLRVTAGGPHCSSSMRCLIVSVITYIPLAAAGIALSTTMQPLYLLGICLAGICSVGLAVNKFGLVPSVNFPDPSQDKVEKWTRIVFFMLSGYCIVVLLVYYLVTANESIRLILGCVSIGTMWQALMITTTGQRLIAVLDRGLLAAKIK